MVRVWRGWPLAVAFIYLAFINITWLMGWMRWLDVPERWYFAVALMASQSEMVWWFWFLGWLPRNLAHLNLVHEFIESFRTQGYPDSVRQSVDSAKETAHAIWRWFRAEVTRLLEPPEGWRTHLFLSMVAFVRTAWRPVAYLAIAGIGATPYVNIIVGIPLVRASRLRGDLIALMAGNTLTVVGTDKVLDAIIWMLLQLRQSL